MRRPCALPPIPGSPRPGTAESVRPAPPRSTEAERWCDVPPQATERHTTAVTSGRGPPAPASTPVPDGAGLSHAVPLLDPRAVVLGGVLHLQALPALVDEVEGAEVDGHGLPVRTVLAFAVPLLGPGSVVVLGVVDLQA